MKFFTEFCAQPEKKYLFLFFGFALSIFSIGRFNIPIFIWIWPYLLLHYMHNDENRLRGILLTEMAIIVANMLRFIGMSDSNAGDDFKAGCIQCVCQVIPFLIDGVFYGVIDKWKSILLFPCSVSSFEFIMSFASRANINLFAYGMFDNLILIQCISLFGCYSLSFLITLFASGLDYCIEVYRTEKKCSKWAFGYIITILILYLYGGIQLRVEPTDKKVKIIMDPGTSNIEYNQLGFQTEYYDADLMTEYLEPYAQVAFVTGSKMLFFAEEAFVLPIENNKTVIAAAQKIAKDYGLYILLSLDIEAEEGPYYNSHAIIDDKGKLLYFYTKHHPIPGVEDDYKQGKDKIKSFETPFGKISSIICYDLNFQYFLNWIAFEHHPDILFVPSWDCKQLKLFI